MTNHSIDTPVFAQRLKELLKQHKETIYTLAQALGLSSATISRYTNARMTPKLTTVEAMAKYFNVSFDWLSGTADTLSVYAAQAYPANVLPLPATRRIPLIGTIACGTPILAQENVEELISMPSEVHADFCLRCKGDSMIGARIFDGDLVFIRSQPDVENGEIAAVLIDDEATLKRVYHYPDKLVLQPENPAYPPLVYIQNELEEIRIIGKAVAFFSTVR